MENSMLVIIFVNCTICLVGLVGHIWFFKLITRNQHLTVFSKIFMISLSVADLSVLLLIPIVAADSIIAEWKFGMAGCKMYFLLEGVGKFESAISIALLGFDRYLGVCHPVKSLSFRKKYVAILLCVIGWVLVVSFMIPIACVATIVPVFDSDDNPSIRCTVMWMEEESSYTRLTYLFALFFVLFLFPLLSIWYCYCSTLIHLIKQRQIRNRQQSTLSPFCQQMQLEQKRTICRYIICIGIVTAYTIFWVPYWVILFGTEFFLDFSQYEKFHLLTILSLIAYSGQYLSSAVNPFIYGIGLKLSAANIRSNDVTRNEHNHIQLIVHTSTNFNTN